MRKIYLVRHCEAIGQDTNAELTSEGLKQRELLKNFFKDKEIDYVISSDYKRAIMSIDSFCIEEKLKINFDLRLKEKRLSDKNLDDWLDKLKLSFNDLDIRYAGGESSRDAMVRSIQVVKEVIEKGNANSIIVTHGALLILILKYYDERFGFEQWKTLKNPDVYILELIEDGNIVISKAEFTVENKSKIDSSV